MSEAIELKKRDKCCVIAYMDGYRQALKEIEGKIAYLKATSDLSYSLTKGVKQ